MRLSTWWHSNRRRRRRRRRRQQSIVCSSLVVHRVVTFPSSVPQCRLPPTVVVVEWDGRGGGDRSELDVFVRLVHAAAASAAKSSSPLFVSFFILVVVDAFVLCYSSSSSSTIDCWITRHVIAAAAAAVREEEEEEEEEEEDERELLRSRMEDMAQQQQQQQQFPKKIYSSFLFAALDTTHTHARSFVRSVRPLVQEMLTRRVRVCASLSCRVVFCYWGIGKGKRKKKKKKKSRLVVRVRTPCQCQMTMGDDDDESVRSIRHTLTHSLLPAQLRRLLSFVVVTAGLTSVWWEAVMERTWVNETIVFFFFFFSSLLLLLLLLSPVPQTDGRTDGWADILFNRWVRQQQQQQQQQHWHLVTSEWPNYSLLLLLIDKLQSAFVIYYKTEGSSSSSRGRGRGPYT